jgi:hypothetical protein
MKEKRHPLGMCSISLGQNHNESIYKPPNVSGSDRANSSLFFYRILLRLFMFMLFCKTVKYKTMIVLVYVHQKMLYGF